MAAVSDDFPTPELLRAADSGHNHDVIEKNDNVGISPSPAVRTKEQIFVLSEYAAIDERARQVYR